MGIITRGRGVSVHRRDCPNLPKLAEEQERLLELDWETEQEDIYTIQIQVQGTDRPNFLHDVTHTMSELGVHVVEGELKTVNGEVGDLFTVQVKNIDQLSRLIKNVMAVPGVTSVQRMDSAPEAER